MREWTYPEAEWLREKVVAGWTLDAICQERRWAKQDVRDQMALMHLQLKATTLIATEYCIACCHEVPVEDFDEDAGFCVACLTKRANEELRFEIDAEAERLRKEEEERENARLRKQRQRMREGYGTNPRK